MALCRAVQPNLDGIELGWIGVDWSGLDWIGFIRLSVSQRFCFPSSMTKVATARQHS